MEDAAASRTGTTGEQGARHRLGELEASDLIHAVARELSP